MAEYTREIIGLLMISLVPLFGFLAFRATRNQRRNQELRIGRTPYPVPSLSTDSIARQAFYVATTFEDEPLKRIWAYGLGARGRAEVSARNDGVLVERVGESDLFIPSSSIRVIGTNAATIDRATEAGGLVQIVWRLGEANLITSLRFVNVADQRAFLSEAKEHPVDSTK